MILFNLIQNGVEQKLNSWETKNSWTDHLVQTDNDKLHVQDYLGHYKTYSDCVNT